jgi:hypothetical protein
MYAKGISGHKLAMQRTPREAGGEILFMMRCVRDKISIDFNWLKYKSLAILDNLADPNVLAE